MWNVLDSTGPHFMTLNFNEYVKNHKTLNRTDEDFAYLVPSEYFFPTIDPAKYFWFRRQCGKFYKLSKIQQKACMTLKVKGVKRIAKCSKFPSKTGCSYGSWLTKHGYFFNHGSIGCRLSMSISAYTPPNSYRIIYRNASAFRIPSLYPLKASNR
jgi:hypothetical protein